MRSEVYRNTIPQKFNDPATLKMVNADLEMFQAKARTSTDVMLK